MRQKQLYLPNGYLDFSQVIDNDYPITFVIGGRGTGKTYGALAAVKDAYEQTGHPYIYMRRTAKQAEIIATQVFNPYKPINNDTGSCIEPFGIIKGVSGFYRSEVDEDGKRHPVGGYYGVIAALSTFSNFRGFDGVDFDICIYDEFIKNAGEKSIKDEAYALKNVYETVNRNRELQGRPALKLICLSNSNAIDNDIFIGFEVVENAEFMIKRNKNQYYDDKRGIAIYNLTDSPISEAKRHTALYKADADSEYTQMALSNKYADYDLSYIKSMPLKEFKPVCRVGEISIYRHKAESVLYVTYHKMGTCDEYGTDKIELSRFIRRYGHLWESYLNQRVYFESFVVKKVFEKFFT